MKGGVSEINNNNNNNDQVYHGVEFSVNFNRRDDQNDDRDRDHQDNDDDDNKVVIDEVDFFSSYKNDVDHTSHDHHPTSDDSTPDICVNTGLHLLTTNTGRDQSTIDDGSSPDADDKRAKNEVAVLEVEIDRMNRENEKLKSMLSQVSHDYNALQMHLVSFMQQRKLQKPLTTHHSEVVQQKEDEEQKIVPRQLMDLLGTNTKVDTDEKTTLSQSLSDEKTDVGSMMSNTSKNINQYDQHHNGKNAREDSDHEDSDAQGYWVPNKIPKLSSPPKGNSSPTDQASAEATMKKARVSVRARSEATMISDGCQWRKYGQKMAKGNPCPRAYYRCTMALGCPVRKQVQRCAEDRSILITTYEGNHNHPLPPAAMAMASTTSAAATMLLSGSMPSGDGLMNPNFLARTMLPCSSNMATISASAPFPTITLDLTHSPNPLQHPNGSQPTSHFLSPTQNGSIPPNILASMPQLLTQTLNNNNNNQSRFSGLHSSSYPYNNQNASFGDSLSAATTAIANDPNFTAALAAAISSIITGGRSPTENGVAASGDVSGKSTGGATTSGNSNTNNNINLVSSSSSMQQQ